MELYGNSFPAAPYEINRNSSLPQITNIHDARRGQSRDGIHRHILRPGNRLSRNSHFLHRMNRNYWGSNRSDNLYSRTCCH